MPALVALPIAARTAGPVGGRQNALDGGLALGLPIASRCAPKAPVLTLPPIGGALDLGSKKVEGPLERRFLDVFALEEVLGQGSFGIVYKCRRQLQSTKELAVKMVDKVECPEEDIKREVELQQKLHNPHVVRVHEVYFERCFVCIVMDIFRGGDLMEALEEHWETKGLLDAHAVAHVQRQMVAALEYLHGLDIVHRDVKGDNFMLDRVDVTDPQCHVALGDFGTAWQLSHSGERLDMQCGTSSHWAPEVFERDYSTKMDIWALGTVIYGMIEGNFPFSGQSEICNKELVFTRELPPEFEDFVQSMLQKGEDARCSASELTQLRWFREDELHTVSRKPRRLLAHSAASFEEVRAQLRREAELKRAQKRHLGREEKPSAGVQGRRRELVTRMQTAAMMRSGTTRGLSGPLRSDFLARSFEVRATRVAGGERGIRRLMWMEVAEAKTAGVPCLEGVDGDLDGYCRASPTERSTLEVVRQMLLDNGIDLSRFGQGRSRTLEDLASEVHSGSSRLMLDATAHRALVRVVDLVLLHITTGSGSDKRVLVQQGERLPDGRQHNKLTRLPGGKKQAHENLKMVVSRVLSDMVGMNRTDVAFDYAGVEVFEKSEESVSYPGVRTVYRTELIYGYFDDEEGVSEHPGHDGHGDFRVQDEEGQERTYEWLPEAECAAAGIGLSGHRGEQEFSSLVQAPVAMDDHALQQVLQGSGIDLKPQELERLSAELVKGESRLRRQPDGRLVRVVHLILLKLTKLDTSEVLVDCSETTPEGDVLEHKWLPGGKQRPDENHFLAAQRILTTKLGIDENCVGLESRDVRVVEEHAQSPTFPGLLTLYRKRIISGVVHPPQLEDDLASPTAASGLAQMRPMRTQHSRSPTGKKCVRWSGA